MDPQLRREDHTGVEREPCHSDPRDRVTARGEDILAWTENAITETEAAAREAEETSGASWGEDGEHVYGEHGVVAVGPWTGLLPDAPRRHIALHHPESVLCRCAADRKLLELHSPHNGNCRTCLEWSETEYHHLPVPFPCDTFRVLAEGYGWTEGER